MRRSLVLVAVAVAAVLGWGVLASASQLAVRSASVTPTMVVPLAAAFDLQLLDGAGTAGRAETGDRVVITFPGPLDVSTLCPGAAPAPTTTVAFVGPSAVQVTIADGGAGNDTLSVVTPAGCDGALALGAIDLGSGAYTSGGSLTFNGGRSSITYDPATRQVSVVFGNRQGSGTQGTAGPVVAVYTPAPTLRYLDGTTVAPATATMTGVAL